MTSTSTKERLVNIAVVMESNPKEQEKMVKMASHDGGFDFVLQVDNPDKFYKYIAGLKKRGIRVNNLLLMGHGSTTYFYEKWWNYLSGGMTINEKLRHKIGNFTNTDLNWKAIQDTYERSKKSLEDSKSDLKEINEKLKKASSAKEIERLEKEKEECKATIQSKKENFTISEQRKNLMDDVSDSMAPGAKVGLFNCYGAEDDSFFNNIGELFLHKHGGVIKGTTGQLLTFITHPLLEWITKGFSTGLHTTGEWKEKTIVPATHCNGYHHKPTCTCGWGGPR